jgi:hypothetical protein
MRSATPVVPAKAGTQYEYASRPRAGIRLFDWMPAFAGMTIYLFVPKLRRWDESIKADQT